jgi:FHS family L-fucose permease-like MFS transporter
VAIIFKFSSIPNQINHDETEELAGDKTSEVAAKPMAAKGNDKSALKYPQLWLGMIGIFVYVGVEVATASNLPLFLTKHMTGADGKPFTEDNVAPWVSLYWASLMMGRWTSSVGAFGVGKTVKSVLRFIMPYLAFGVFLAINKIFKHDVTPFYVYAFVIVALIVGDLLSKGNPARQLLIFSGCGMAALIIGMSATSFGLSPEVSVFSFVSVGMFCSTLWPCIFTLAIAGLGRHTNEGASFLIMMIMGGGFISVLQGWLAGDHLLGIQASFVVGVLCFAYLAFYAVRAKAILKTQGIDYDKLESSGGH